MQMFGHYTKERILTGQLRMSEHSRILPLWDKQCFILCDLLMATAHSTSTVITVFEQLICKAVTFSKCGLICQVCTLVFALMTSRIPFCSINLHSRAVMRSGLSDAEPFLLPSLILIIQPFCDKMSTEVRERWMAAGHFYLHAQTSRAIQSRPCKNISAQFTITSPRYKL